MTKKTNSLMFRFGFSTLWRSKSISSKTIANILKLENIIYKELNKKKLNILLVSYKLTKVDILFYNNIEIYNNYKRQILLYYKKNLNLYKTVEKFSLNEKIVINILKTNSIINIKLFNTNIIVKNRILVYFFFIRHFLLNFMFIFLKLLNQKSSLKYLVILKSLNLFHIKFIQDANTVRLNFKFKKKLRRIFGLTTINLFTFQLENIIFLISGLNLKVNLNNILLQKGSILPKKVNKIFKQSELRLTFFLFFLATNYNNSRLISDYLSGIIKTNKSHQRVLKFYINFIETLFNLNLIKILGLQLRITGKLNGKLRKSKYHYQLGIVQLQKLNIGLSYSMAISYTRFGIISIKT